MLMTSSAPPTSNQPVRRGLEARRDERVWWCEEDEALFYMSVLEKYCTFRSDVENQCIPPLNTIHFLKWFIVGIHFLQCIHTTLFLAGLFLCKYKSVHLLKVVCRIIPTGSGAMNPICRWIRPNYMWKWPCMTWDVQMALTVEVKALHWSCCVIIQSNPQMSGCQSQNLIILTDMSWVHRCMTSVQSKKCSFHV